MLDQSFNTASGLKVRTIEAEAAGGLVELDLRGLKQTTEGTYLLPSKDLQAAGKWAFTLDVAQAKKEGKPVSPEDEKNTDTTLLILQELMQQVPKIIASVKDVKNSRPHPFQVGMDKALSEEAAEIAKSILHDDAAMRERLQEIVEHYLEANVLEAGENEEQEPG